MRRTIHYFWRNAWGVYEQHPNRVSRWVFNRLDALHDRVGYVASDFSHTCRCRRRGDDVWPNRLSW